MPLDLQQVWEGESGDDREPGDRPLTRIQLVRRWVDGRGIMGLLKYAAGSAAIVALACSNSAARAQSRDQLPPVEVNPESPSKPARQIHRDRDRRTTGPISQNRRTRGRDVWWFGLLDGQVPNFKLSLYFVVLVSPP